MCSRVQVALVLSVEYFNWRIRDFTNLLVFWEVYINLTEVCGGDVKRRFSVHIYNSHCRHASTIFGNNVEGSNYLHQVSYSF